MTNSNNPTLLGVCRKILPGDNLKHHIPDDFIDKNVGYSSGSNPGFYYIDAFQNKEELNKSWSIDSSLGAGYKDISAKLKTDYETKTTTSSENCYVLIMILAQTYKTYLNSSMSENEIDKSFKIKLENEGGKNFYAEYGDGYVASIQYGAGFYAVMEFDKKEYEKLRQISSGAEFKALDFANLAGDVKVLQNKIKSQSNFRLKSCSFPTFLPSINNMDNASKMIESIIIESTSKFSKEILDSTFLDKFDTGKKKADAIHAKYHIMDVTCYEYFDPSRDFSEDYIKNFVTQRRLSAEIWDLLHNSKTGVKLRFENLVERKKFYEAENYDYSYVVDRNDDISYKFTNQLLDLFESKIKPAYDADEDIRNNIFIAKNHKEQLEKIKKAMDLTKQIEKFALRHTLIYKINPNISDKSRKFYSWVKVYSIPGNKNANCYFFDVTNDSENKEHGKVKLDVGIKFLKSFLVEIFTDIMSYIRIIMRYSTLTNICRIKM